MYSIMGRKILFELLRPYIRPPPLPPLPLPPPYYYYYYYYYY